MECLGLFSQPFVIFRDVIFNCRSLTDECACTTARSWFRLAIAATLVANEQTLCVIVGGRPAVGQVAKPLCAQERGRARRAIGSARDMALHCATQGTYCNSGLAVLLAPRSTCDMQDHQKQTPTQHTNNPTRWHPSVCHAKTAGETFDTKPSERATAKITAC